MVAATGVVAPTLLAAVPPVAPIIVGGDGGVDEPDIAAGGGVGNAFEVGMATVAVVEAVIAGNVAVKTSAAHVVKLGDTQSCSVKASVQLLLIGSQAALKSVHAGLSSHTRVSPE
jgi:hypothetical protein